MRKTRPNSKPDASTGSLWTGVAGMLALTLLGSFFLPWLSFLGTPVAAHEIRERLRGPHRLLSAFTENSQVSLDYTLSLFLWAIPLASALVLAACFLPRLRRAQAGSAFLAGIAGIAGLAGIAAFLFLRIQLRSYPFQRLEEGAWLALVAGIGLIAVSAIRVRRLIQARVFRPPRRESAVRFRRESPERSSAGKG